MASESSSSSLIEQLSKAFLELEARNAASGDKVVQWKEMEEHFLNLDVAFKQKFTELEAKEKEFEQKEYETDALIADREADVAANEQEMLDRVQELRDVAVAAILAVASICDVGGGRGSDLHLHEATAAAKASNAAGVGKVSSSFFNNGTSNSTIEEDYYYCKNNNPPKGTVEYIEEVKPRPELVEFCQQMDAAGLVNFTMENKRDLFVIRSELPVALASAAEPARFVLDLLLEEYYPYYPPLNDDERDGAHLIFLEAMAAFMAKAAYPPEGDDILNHEIKQQAKQIADEWMLKLAASEEEGTTGAAAAKGHNNNNSLRAAALLQLLATYRIASDFDQDQLCKLVLAVAHRRQAPNLCLSLGLTDKMSAIIQVLIKSARQVDAVRLIQAFQLTESFPLVPLLKAYLKELRRNSQGKGGPKAAEGGSSDPQNDVNARELAALKAVIGSVKEFNLEADYALEPLEKRLEQLENMGNNKKRAGGGGDQPRNKKQQPFKKSKSKGPPPHHHHKFRSAPFIPRGGGGGASSFSGSSSSRYPPAPAHHPPPNAVVAHHHSYHESPYQIPGQSSAYTYAPQQAAFDPRSFNANAAAAAAAAVAATTSYGTYTSSSNGLQHTSTTYQYNSM